LPAITPTVAPPIQSVATSQSTPTRTPALVSPRTTVSTIPQTPTRIPTLTPLLTGTPSRLSR
jgi:hypothetical protein